MNDLEQKKFIDEKKKKILSKKQQKNLDKNHNDLNKKGSNDNSQIKRTKKRTELLKLKQQKHNIRVRVKKQKELTKANSKKILNGAIVSTTNYQPDLNKYIIELSDVKKTYITGEVETVILDHLNLKLRMGAFNVILGPSGSGKTTLLNLISGLDKATEGDIFVVGKNLSLLKDADLTKFRREYIGFIFQQYNLLTNLTAKENAEVGENLAKKKDKNWTIKKIFQTIDMEEQMEKYPHQMSGGQQQRVSIARALAKRPQILFGDEPTGALDEETGRKVLEILININRNFKTTIILVTHNPNIAKIADVIIHVLNGKIDRYIENKNPQKASEIEWT